MRFTGASWGKARPWNVTLGRGFRSLQTVAEGFESPAYIQAVGVSCMDANCSTTGDL